jgi:hypothetical protein
MVKFSHISVVSRAGDMIDEAWGAFIVFTSLCQCAIIYIKINSIYSGGNVPNYYI